MAWRPQYFDDYGYQQHKYSHQQQHQQYQQAQGYGRGFIVPLSNSNANTFTYGRGYGRSRPIVATTTVPQGFGRGTFPYNGPQMAENFSTNEFHRSTDHYQDSAISSVNSRDFPPLSQSHAKIQKQHMPTERIFNKEIENLENIWGDNKYPDKKSKLEALFGKLSTILTNQANPWECAFGLITLTPDYDAAKTTTLSFQILLHFEKWIRSSRNSHAGDEDSFLSQDFRVQVFYAMTGRHIAYFSSAVGAFHLCHPGNEYFLPLAKALLLRDKLAEAAQVVSRLCLQSHFSRDEILVPLLLTDRINLIECYIKGDNQQQMLILSLLDYLCARNSDIVSFAQSTGLKNIKAEKLNKKSLSKFAMRLIKMFDIPPEMCPNISENRAMSTVRFLLYKHYVEKSMTSECWDDMVESVIGNNVSLQQQFIMELMSFNDIQEAVKWVDRYQLPDTVLDPSVVEAKKNYIREKKDHTPLSDQKLQQPPSSFLSDDPSRGKSSETPAVNEHDNDRTCEEDWDKELSAPEKVSVATPSASIPGSIYYCIPLSEESILLVDTKEKLMSALGRLTRPSTAIGIDCEWKPIGPSKQVALLQLAVDDCVFLVDFIQLDGHVSPQDWKHFARSLFCDDKILKIGYGLDTDLRMLSSSYPTMKEPLMKMVRVVELSKLAKTVDDLLASKEDMEIGKSNSGKERSWRGSEEGSSEESKIDFHSGGSRANSSVVFGLPFKNEEKGLSLLVKKIIGKPLCKDEQMSNWEKRPLRRSQILYAELLATERIFPTKPNGAFTTATAKPKFVDISQRIAMDAYVLLEIHTNLVSQANTLGVNSRDILEPSVVFKAKTRLDKKKHKMNASKKKSVMSHPSFSHATSSCRPHELRVVCDSMLQGLGNQLRSCGVDTHILSTGQLHDDAVQVRGRVGEGMCYCVSNTIKSKDQCIDVLRHFKVEVTVDDIFSRCAVCNGADFAHIPSVDMEKLYIAFLQGSHPQHHQPTTTAAYRFSPNYHYSLDIGINASVQQSFLSKYGVDTITFTFMHNGVRLQMETVASLEAFQSIDLFFVCVGCGKVYWKGSHFERIREQFKPILTLDSQLPGPATQPPYCHQNPVDVVGGMSADNSTGNVGGVVGDYYYEEEGDHEAVQNDLENVNLQEAGFTGVWKIS